MADLHGDRGDRYDGGLPWSAEGVNITRQPQPTDPPPPYSQIDQGASCPPLRKILFSTVKHDGMAHSASVPLDCFRCGEEVADMLVKQLSVGIQSEVQSKSSLQFGDVMVLTPTPEISYVTGLVHGLRYAKIPVRLVNEDDADVTADLNEANEVLVAYRGVVGRNFSRRILILPQGNKSDNSQSLADVRPVLRHAEHVIFVRYPPNNGAITDDVMLNVEDGLALEAIDLLASENPAAPKTRNQGPEGDADVPRAENEVMLSVTERHLQAKAADIHAVKNAPHRYHQPTPNASNERYHSYQQPASTDNRDGYSRRVDSGYNRNDCCDNFCLACSYDCGETGCIVCCPCCDQLGTWCDSCCQGFGESLNGCCQFLLCGCDCCSSSSSYGGGSSCHGDSCGDCGNCDCNCGDCNCDCGSCDCSIM